MNRLESLAEAAMGDHRTLADRLGALLLPLTDAEMDDACQPHPHVFQSGERGLFPVGEVSVIGAPGREGKTTVVSGACVAVAIQHSLGGMHAPIGRSVVIYSGEDDRKQYHKKFAAHRSLLSAAQGELMRQRIIVPDLDDPDMAPFRALVTVFERQAVPSGTADAVIEAVAPMMLLETRPVLLVFETASTLSDADEDNRSHKLLIAELKKIARALGVAVLLVHHTSQNAANNLADLNISVADIRGGTALVFNSRQNAMIVNLGSDADPFPDADARTVLRHMVAANEPSRISALITLDSSKGMDPPPMFFRWVSTENAGPAAVEHEPPNTVAGKSWRKLREMVGAERGNQRTEARSNATNANTTLVVGLVSKMHATGKQPTARAVSIAAGKSQTWAKPYLEAAVDEGLLRSGKEPIERMKDGGTVYRPTDSTSVAA